MDSKVIIGHILINIGKQLTDKDSELYKSFDLCKEQLAAVIMLLKVASSPQTHIQYIGDLAMRYKVSERTIRNWISDGAIPKGKEHDSGDNREYWLMEELYEIDKSLERSGRIKKAGGLKGAVLRLKKLIKNFN